MIIQSETLKYHDNPKLIRLQRYKKNLPEPLLQIKKTSRNCLKFNQFLKNFVNSQLFVIFAEELKWIDLYCLQPQEKMLKILSCRSASFFNHCQFIMFY